MNFFVTDLRHLSSLVDVAILDDWLTCAEINGLSAMFQQQTKAAISMERIDLYKVVERARVLVSSEDVV